MNGIMAVLLFAMMTITAIDVIGRYVFNAPVPGGFEIVQYLMAVVIFASLPLTTAAERHLTVSVFENRFRGTTRHVYRLVMLTISLIALAIIAWRMGVQADVLGRSQQVSGFLQLPLAPIAWVDDGARNARRAGSRGQACPRSVRASSSPQTRRLRNLELIDAASHHRVSPSSWRSRLSGIPLGFALILVGIVGFAAMRSGMVGKSLIAIRWREPLRGLDIAVGRPCHGRPADVRHLHELRPDRHPAVRADGRLHPPGRSVGRACTTAPTPFSGIVAEALR